MPPEHQNLITTRLISLLFLLSLGGATKFDFGTLPLGGLKLLGDAHLKNGSIRLSRDLPVPNSGAGRALYSDPIRIRHPITRLPLPFSTFFSFSIVNLNPSSIGGGLAFVLSSDDHSLGDAGGFLGLLNSSGYPSDSVVVAVEFDTLMDVAFEDINSNHVGIDVNSMVSAEVADLDAAGIDLKSGDLINAWIDYGGGADDRGVMKVFVSYSTVRPADPVLSSPLDLGRFVEDFMFVGFSGSTQGSTEIHSIDWWSFSSSSTPPPPPPPLSPPPPSSSSSISPTVPVTTAAESPKNNESETLNSPSPSPCQNNGLCRQGPAAVAGVATAGAFFIAACAAVAMWLFAKKSPKTLINLPQFAPNSDLLHTPREFTYRELTAATRNFDSSRIIGHGAFGTVYKGILPATGALVAVKRCIQSGAAARSEFLSELSIIAALRHRNLVRLQGYCHQKGELLLIYDYMPNGSLDKALFDPNSPPLPWPHRKNILAGVASALAYLHRDCDRQVIHRDVKSSNVMLDAGFHPRLGDFGLARQLDHGASPDPTVTAGTMGYLAPEYLLTGRATDKTDVFSFGALALEVACGRRPIDSPTKKGANLVDWVWTLHGEGRLSEAADEKLKFGGEFDETEIIRVMLIGLACSSPDPAMRPGMRSVVQMLSGEAEVPAVPTAKPSMSVSSNHQLLMSLQDSVSDYNGMMGFELLSDSSSSSGSLISTLRGGGGGGGRGG